MLTDPHDPAADCWCAACIDADRARDRAAIAQLRHDLAVEHVRGERLPDVGAFGGPVEPCGCVERCIGCGSLPGERWRGCHSREDAGCVFGTDSTGCRACDGHHEGDAPLVIGWGL